MISECSQHTAHSLPAGGLHGKRKTFHRPLTLPPVTAIQKASMKYKSNIQT